MKRAGICCVSNSQHDRYRDLQGVRTQTQQQRCLRHLLNVCLDTDRHACISHSLGVTAVLLLPESIFFLERQRPSIPVSRLHRRFRDEPGCDMTSRCLILAKLSSNVFCLMPFGC